jgi:hypothetical protein
MNISVLRIDTGVLSAAAVMNNYTQGPGAMIPEPSTYALLSVGAAALLAWRRRTAA